MTDAIDEIKGNASATLPNEHWQARNDREKVGEDAEAELG
jgi:hypothetical protein